MNKHFTVQWRRDVPGWIDAGTEWTKAQATEVAKELMSILSNAIAVRVIDNSDGSLVWDFWLKGKGS